MINNLYSTKLGSRIIYHRQRYSFTPMFLIKQSLFSSDTTSGLGSLASYLKVILNLKKLVYRKENSKDVLRPNSTGLGPCKTFDVQHCYSI